MGGCASTEKSPMAAEPVDTSWEGTFRNYAAWLDYHARTCRQGLHPPSGTTAAGTFQSDTAQYSLHLQPSVRRGWNVDGQVREEKEVRVISQGRLAANGQAYWVEETPEQGRILTLSTFDWNTVTWKITSRHYDTTASAKKDENSSRHSKKNGVVKKVALDETLVHTTLDSHDSSTASPEKLHKQPEIVVALLKPPAKMTPIASSLQDSWGIALDDCHTQATARVVAARGLSNEDSWQFATVVALREHTVGGNSALALDMPLALVNHHRVRSSFEATQRFWEPPLGKVPAQLHGNLAPPPSSPLVVVGFANYSCYQVERHRRLVSATIYKPEATTKTGITLRQLEDKVYIVDFGNQSPWKETQLQLAMRVWAVNEQPAIDCHQVSTIIQQTKGWVVLVAERPEDVESSATAERDQATTFFVSPSAPPLLSPMPVLAEPVRDIPSNITYKVNFTASEAIRAKRVFERDLASMGVTVLTYHSDQGVFTASQFQDELLKRNQVLSYSGTGAQHQNAVAERAIGVIVATARTMMLHAKLRWPDAVKTNLWPMAMKHAQHLWNHIPRENNVCPMDLITVKYEHVTIEREYRQFDM